MPVRRPARRERKQLVEHSFALPAGALRRALARSRLAGGPALITARRPDDAGNVLEIRVRPLRADGREVEIAYEHEQQTCRLRLTLVAIAQHFGGVRWVVKCPLGHADGRPCMRRARALYLPPGRRYFACRRCHDLTWRSVQRPVVSRLRRVADTLARFERDLDSRDLMTQVGAIVGAKETIRSFLDSVRDAEGA